MTQNQQTELEQVARAWVAQHELVFKGDVKSLVQLLAAQRVTVLEEVEKEVKGRRCELGLKLYPSRPLFSGLRENYAAQDEALRLFEGWISKKAQEQRL